jgi:serine phosphatase RsbU (regulator of sigma subunit)
VKKLLSDITNFGITVNTPFSLRNKLRVFNSANLAIFFISIFYCSIGLLNGFHIAAGVTGYSILSTLFSFLLVKKGKADAAFHYMIWFGFFFLTSFSLLFGNTNNSYYYFFFLPVACNILFDNKKIAVSYMLLSALLMTVNIFWIEQYDSYYHIDARLHYLNYPNILFLMLLIFLGVRLFKVENQKYAHQIEEQKETLAEKNREITDSINYAKRIQSALIPSEEEFNKYFKESFVLFRPKDIVSGDFYWITKKEGKIFYVTADCTGHGVPGGFMTMLGISFLDQIINDSGITEPARILDTLRERLIHTLKQTGTAGENKDGMDIVLCCIDEASEKLTYSAANNSLYIYRDHSFNEYKPDKQPCGFHHDIKPFTQHEIDLKPGDLVYTFTDGFADQFGGPKGKKYKYKQLEQTIIDFREQPLNEQLNKLTESFDSWKGNLEQIDDVCVIGIKI